SDIGSPRADDYEYLMLPEMLEDPYVEVAFQVPPSPDYMPGPEEPEQAPPLPDYIPAPANSIVVAPTAADQAPSAKETELFETDESAATPPPHPTYQVARLLAISSPPASPLSPWSSPPPQIPFPPLPPILSPPS
nr:hypothetical protein [Tanacetum cinerariifolium]